MNESAYLILIVEDDEEMAQFNARLLIRKGYKVIVAHNIAEARSVIFGNNFDLFILDIDLPDGDGISLCRELRRKSDAPVLFLTGKSKAEDKVMGLGAYGDYYLTKPYDRDEFLAVVQSLFRRLEQTKKKITEISVITRGSLTLKMQESKAFINGRDAELTPKEFAILLKLVQNENKEVTYEQLYEDIWGMDMNNDSSVIRQQVSRLKKKIDEENACDFAIFNEHKKGYVFTMI